MATTLAEMALIVRADMARVKPDVVRGSGDAGQAGGKRLADSLSKDFASRLNTQLRSLNIKPVDLKLGTNKSDAAIASLTKKLAKVRDDSSKPYEIRVKADDALQNVERLEGKLGDVGKRSKDLSQITDAAGVLGLGLLGAAGTAIKFGADFDKSMSAVVAASGAGADEVNKLRKAAIQAGADTQYSATQAADGITALSKAGVQTADILNGGLKGALNLAAAGEIDVADAAETAATAMTQFKLQGGQIPHVADLLAAGAGKAQGSVADLSAALNQSGLVASQTGLTIEDTTGALAAFASAGLTGSDAGTSFKTMLQALQAPSGKTLDLMNSLGISAYDAQGGFVGITKLAGSLQDRLHNLTPELRANALAQIFGSDAVRAASVLYEQGQSGIQGWIDKTNDAGYAAKQAAALTDNLSGDLERLKGSLETQFIKGGSGAGGGLRVLTQFVNGLVDNFGRLPPVVSGSLTVLTAVGGVALVAGAGFLKARQKLGELRAELVATGPAGVKTADGIGKVTSAAGKAAAAIAIWQAAMAAADQFASKIDANTEAMAAGLQKFGQGADLAGNSAQVLGGNLENLTTGFKFLADADNNRRVVAKNLEKGLESVIPGLNDYAKSLANTQTQVTAVDTALSTMVASGNLQGANDAFARLTKELAVNGVSVDEVKKQFPQYANALEAAAHKANGLTGATGDATAGTNDLGKAAQAAKDKVDALDKAFGDLFKQYMNTDEAALNLKETEISTNKVFEHGTKTLGLNTDEGRTNRKAVLDRLGAINDMREAEIKNGTSVDKASAKYRTQVDALRATLKHMGFLPPEINKLIGKYKDIPNKVDTKVSISGDGAVGGKLSLLGQAQQALKKGTPIPKAAAHVFGPFFDKGGWTGPGSKYDPAGIVHADEYVIPKESRQRVERDHPGALDHIKDTGKLPGYDGGGRVVWPFPVNASGTRVPSAKEVGNAVGGAGIAGALNWARSQVGKPYIWASAGPNGYDCSGFQSAIINFLQHKPLYHRRFSTGEAGGSHLAGLTRGKQSQYMIGVFKGNPGHTAGTINGVNVESSGSAGVRVGGGARGAHSSMFDLHYGYAGGGRVGDAPFDLLDPRGSRYSPRLAAMLGYRTAMAGAGETSSGIQKVAVADSGRVTLDRGWNLVGNGTGRPETLSTDAAGGVTVNIYGSVIASKQQAEDIMVEAWHSAVKKKRITVKPS
jgi:TP901 family phage tail tape measure protein